MASVELASILITDLVGSTGLESRVGPARADELRRDHFGVLRDSIDACDGPAQHPRIFEGMPN